MSNIVTIRRNGIKRRISKEQWNSMLKNEATYGWQIYNELPPEVSDVEEKIILTENQTGITQTPEVSDVEEKKSGNIINLLNAGFRTIKDELPHLTLGELNQILKAEMSSENPRKTVIGAIENQIAKTSKP